MIISRFAPSPTGFLHLGHAYSALLAFQLAKTSNGLFKLRIEDIDSTRCKKIYHNEIYYDLNWLGVKWEKDVFVQSDRIYIYKNYINFLNDRGLVYGCECSRSDINNAISALDKPFKYPNVVTYPGTCRKKKLDIWSNNVRINVEKINHHLGSPTLSFNEKGTGPNGEKGIQQFDLQWFKQTLGDIVIARRDIRTSYHLASTIDDFHQNVSLVTRGNDLFYDTPVHVLLQKLFNFKIPNFYHHKLINDQNGKKLSKSKNSESLNQLREKGMSLDEIKSLIEQ